MAGPCSVTYIRLLSLLLQDTRSTHYPYPDFREHPSVLKNPFALFSAPD
jgi:hypothetical protein